MGTEGAEIFCKHCGKRWLLQENGQLKAAEGETEFPDILGSADEATEAPKSPWGEDSK